MLSLERSDDPAVARWCAGCATRRSRGFATRSASCCRPDTPPSKADRVVTELTAFAVALSDGVFFAEHLEPDATDVERMYRRLFQAVAALIPILLEEK